MMLDEFVEIISSLYIYCSSVIAILFYLAFHGLIHAFLFPLKYRLYYCGEFFAISLLTHQN